MGGIFRELSALHNPNQSFFQSGNCTILIDLLDGVNTTAWYLFAAKVETKHTQQNSIQDGRDELIGSNA